MKAIQLLAVTAAMSACWLTPRAVAQGHFSTLYKFQGSPDGQAPQGLVVGAGGMIYGATASGGAGFGTVFQLQPPATPGGVWTETILHTFTNQNGDGASPFAGVALGPGGVLYGTASGGGINYEGSIFELQPPAESGGTWTYTEIVENYDLAGGLNRGLVVDKNGEIYGTTSTGYEYYGGTVFRLTPPAAPGGAWTVTLVYTFGQAAEGQNPTGVVLGADGALYGTTAYGGSYGAGTVFSLAPSSTLPGVLTYTVLYNFTGDADGAVPLAPPVIGKGGVLYGTTSGGGSIGSGTAFELTPPDTAGGAWAESVIYSFGAGDGKLPNTPLILHGGALYGTTAAGTGAGNQGGSVFELQPPATSGEPWTEIILHNFGGEAAPSGPIYVDQSGVLYGVTAGGPGAHGFGMVYRIKP